MTDHSRPIAEVLGDIAENVQRIARAEIRLAKAELKEDAALMKRSAVLFGIGAMAAALAVGLLALTAVNALAIIVPLWAATLIVAAAIGIVALLCMTAARRHMQELGLPRTAATVKENVQWVKTRI